MNVSSKLPRILIGAPQSDKKNYCFDEWLANVRNFTYPKENVEIFLADNSDTPDNYRYFTQKLGIKGTYIGGKKNIIEKIADSHNAVRKYALDNKFDYLFHLETDIFPEETIIEKLLFHRMKLTACPYHVNIDMDGSFKRDMCVEILLEDTQTFKKAVLVSDADEFFDGKLKICQAAGLGCVLIHKDVLQQIPFRYERGVSSHPDSFFAVDCILKNIPFYIDTGLFATHKNFTKWGEYDFKSN
jgi:hypothetical protein